VNVAVGVIFTCSVTVSDIEYCTVVGPLGYSKPDGSIACQQVVSAWQ